MKGTEDSAVLSFFCFLEAVPTSLLQKTNHNLAFPFPIPPERKGLSTAWAIFLLLTLP